MKKIRETLEEKGFTVVGAEERQRQAILREYVGHLNRGEFIESVRADFVRNFEHVDAAEIAEAEQDLIKGGMPLKDVQKLCDVHSALFHDCKEMEKAELQGIAEKTHKAAAVSQFFTEEDLPQGHLLSLLKLENQELIKHLDAVAHEMTGAEDMAEITGMVAELNAVCSHYAKKEELLMPMLYDYGVTGPSQVMWGVDDEIKPSSALSPKS